MKSYIAKNIKSIIKEKGYKISESYTPRLKYLDAVDKAYFN